MLLDSLNQLLHSLSLPYVLDSTSDLTPTLLLATLACLLRTPLLSITSKKELDDTITTLADLSQQIPHDNGSIDADGSHLRSAHAEMHQVKQMKLLLGVLENDVLSGEDVGLYEIDPRRLARGEREEVEFVGELFVWLGKRLGYLPDSSGSTSQRQTPPISASRAGRIYGGVVQGFAGYNDVHQGKSRTSNRPSSPSATTITTNTESMNPTNLSMHSFTPSINAETITSPPSTFAASIRAIPSYPRSQNHAASSPDHGRNGDELEFEVHRTRSGPDGTSYPPDQDHAYNSRASRTTTTMPPRPRCIHELQFELDDILPSNYHSPPSELSSYHPASNGPTIMATPCEFTSCHCDLSSMPHPRPLVPMKTPLPSLSSQVDASMNIEVPVRYEGVISPIDEEAEIASFEAASRSFLSPTGAMSSVDPLASAHHHMGVSIPRSVSSVASSGDGHFTFDDELRLMEERARLLGELALATWR